MTDDEGRRKALIVSAQSYTDPKLRQLRSPAGDAEALRRVLADPEIGGFHDVELSPNEANQVVRRKIEDFFKEGGLEDLLVLHFGCHGIKDDDGNLYFASTDTEFTRLESTAIPADFVIRQMDRSRSRRIVVLLDCCYSGAFSAGARPRAGGGVDQDLLRAYESPAHAERWAQRHGKSCPAPALVHTFRLVLTHSWPSEAWQEVRQHITWLLTERSRLRSAGVIQLVSRAASDLVPPAIRLHRLSRPG